MIVSKENQQHGSKAALSVTRQGTAATLMTWDGNLNVNNEHILPVLPWLMLFCILSDAYDTAKMLCEKYYLASPGLKIEEFNSKIFLWIHAFDRSSL